MPLPCLPRPAWQSYQPTLSGAARRLQGNNKASKDLTKLAWVNRRSWRGERRIYVSGLPLGSRAQRPCCKACSSLRLPVAGCVYFRAVAVKPPPLTRTTPLQVNSTSTFRPGQWYKLGIAQNPFPGGPTVAVANPSSSLIRNLTTMFSNPVLQATAAAAAENMWSIVPRGTLARAGGVPTPAVGARPLPPLLLKAAEYAPASLFSHMLEDGDVVLPPRPALAALGTIDAYLCECMRMGLCGRSGDAG